MINWIGLHAVDSDARLVAAENMVRVTSESLDQSSSELHLAHEVRRGASVPETLSRFPFIPVEEPIDFLHA
jgi:hypothetical protein